MPPNQLTLLVIGDPAASFLKPLAALPSDVHVIVSKDRDKLRAAAPEADVIFNAEFFDGSFLAEILPIAKKLKWIHAISAGVERLAAIPEVRATHVPLTNARGVFREPLGEWIVGMMIFFAYEFRRVMNSQAAGKWEPFDHENLYGRTLGIVGYGEIGRAAAERAHAFNMRILATRRRVAPDDLAEKIYSPDQLHEMLPQCDFVAITAPLTPQTRHMIGAKEIALLKSTAVLINVGRGPIIDQAALVDALQHKKIRGAALDVFEVEPLPEGDPLWQLDNVYVSPHNADRTYTKRDSATEFFIENFKRFRGGQPLLNIVDKHAGY